MDWNAFGAIGEVVGAAAVVATLVYLARQTRVNTRSIYATSASSYMQAYSAAWGRISDPAIGRVFSIGMNAPDELTLEELVSFEAIIASFLPLWESMFVMHEQGSIEEKYWLVARADIIWMANHDGGRRFLEQCLSLYEQNHPGFCTELRGCLASKPSFRSLSDDHS